MLLKDYYAILELEPPATQAQIKRAYRKLALLYHPDKNQADPYAHSRFADIKEAYEVLTNPHRREEYLQQRWFHSSMGKKTTAETTTPASLLKYFLALDRRLAHSDQFRMDNEAVAAEMNALLSRENQAMLLTYQDHGINQEIVKAAIRCMKFVPYASLSGLVSKLEEIVPKDKSRAAIQKFMNARKKNLQWERWRVPVLFLLVILICLLIFLASK